MKKVFSGIMLTLLLTSMLTLTLNTQPAQATSTIKTRILDPGDDLIHGFTYYKGYLWASTRTSPCRILKIDSETLDYERIILTAGLNDGEDLIAADGYIWVILYTSPSKIVRVDPTTFTWEVAVSFKSGELSAGGSLEYAFGYLWAGGQDRKIAKIDLTNLVYEIFSYSGSQQFHALASGGGYIWGSCPHYSYLYGWYADTIFRINPSNPTQYTSVYISAPMTDDMAYANGYLYAGSEKSPSFVYKISDSMTYSSQQASNTFSYGISADYGSIWGVYVGSPGKVVEFDLNLNTKATHELPSGFNNANEIAFDTVGNMYVTCWESPAKIVKSFFYLSEQSQLKAPWKGTAEVTQGNNGATSHYDHGTWDNTYALDIALSVGTDVLAPADGYVKYVDNDPGGGGGKELAIEHTGPTGKKFVTVYLHLSSILVGVGRLVYQGQVVAKSGDTGYVTGPHLHFHMWRPRGSEPEWAYDSHTMPIERLVLKQVNVDGDFREYDARKGELDDSIIAGKLFESNNTCFAVSTYTDKYIYHAGDTMHLGLDVTNPNSVKYLCFALWVTLPDSSIYLYMHEHSVTLPIELNYANPSFQSVKLPSLPSGKYTWHAAFLERATHKTIVEDTAEWEFSVAYDRSAAYNYAQKYWDEVCSDGYFWNTPTTYISLSPGTDIRTMTGYDCAHFVSCCIGNELNDQGGGLDVPSRVPPTYGEPGAAKLGDWLISSGNGVEKTSVAELEVGDVISYDWDGDGHWDHIALYLGNNEVAAHTQCVWTGNWELGGAADYRFTHIIT